MAWLRKHLGEAINANVVSHGVGCSHHIAREVIEDLVRDKKGATLAGNLRGKWYRIETVD